MAALDRRSKIQRCRHQLSHFSRCRKADETQAENPDSVLKRRRILTTTPVYRIHVFVQSFDAVDVIQKRGPERGGQTFYDRHTHSNSLIATNFGMTDIPSLGGEL